MVGKSLKTAALDDLTTGHLLLSLERSLQSVYRLTRPSSSQALIIFFKSPQTSYSIITRESNTNVDTSKIHKTFKI